MGVTGQEPGCRDAQVASPDSEEWFVQGWCPAIGKTRERSGEIGLHGKGVLRRESGENGVWHSMPTSIDHLGWRRRLLWRLSSVVHVPVCGVDGELMLQERHTGPGGNGT